MEINQLPLGTKLAGVFQTVARIMNNLADIASTTNELEVRRNLLDRSGRVVAGCSGLLPEDEMAKLRQRLAALSSRVTPLASQATAPEGVA